MISKRKNQEDYSELILKEYPSITSFFKIYHFRYDFIFHNSSRIINEDILNIFHHYIWKPITHESYLNNNFQHIDDGQSFDRMISFEIL